MLFESLITNLARSAFVGVLTVSGIFISIENDFDNNLTATWLVLCILVNLLRGLTPNAVKQFPNIKQAHWLYVIRFLSFLSGVGYSSILWVFSYQAIDNWQIVIIWVGLIGLTSGATMLLSVDKPSQICLQIPIAIISVSFLWGTDFGGKLTLTLFIALFMFAFNRYSYELRSRIIDNIKINYELIRMATHDDLSGLLGRSEFEKQFENFNSSKSHSMALLFIDLDNFKNLNDTLGHRTGDEAIVSVSNILRRQVEKRGLACRQGGDEFVLLFNDYELEKLKEIGEEIIYSVNNLKFGESASIGIGCSIGIAYAKHSLINYENLLEAADNECYKSKALGKNTISHIVIGE